MHGRNWRNGLLAAVIGTLGCASWSFAADAPSAKLALSFRPVQSDVDYETPAANMVDQCKVNVERQGKSSGWVVLGPGGQTLRRFVDTNADNVVDQWRYYQNGIEIYRDVDTNYNNKVDQCRWLNTAGTRWGLDSNEDGKIDAWKSISAEEATREAIRALVARDEKILQPLLITKADLTVFGLPEATSVKLLERISDPAAKLRKAASDSKMIHPRATWMRFDSAMPSLIPADQISAKSDLLIYEHVMAIVETGAQPGLVQIGEMIRVGDGWKLTRIPQPIEGNQIEVAAGIFTQPSIEAPGPAASPAAPAGITPQVQKLVDDLQTLDQKAPPPTAGRTELVDFNNRRADILQKLLDSSTTDVERDQWTRQLVDGLTAAVQTGSFDEGLTRLDKIGTRIETEAKKKPALAPLVAYVAYRQLLAKYSQMVQNAPAAKRNDIQERWLTDLEGYVKKYPQGEDSAEATLQLAITQEFSGKEPEAREWYEKLRTSYVGTPPSKRAEGALRRLDLVGKKFDMKGPGLKGGEIDMGDYRGRVVLVLYWATWCKPCTEDLPQIRALYQQQQGAGFEIIGVNLDTGNAGVDAYLNEHQIKTWPQIHEPGGLESAPAVSLGIISLPTMILVDREGKVVSRNASVADLQTTLPQLLKKD